MSTELLKKCKIIISNIDKLRANAIELDRFTTQTTREGRELDTNRLDLLPDDSDTLMIKTGNTFKELKNQSNRTIKEQSLIVNLESNYLDTLQRFTAAQRRFVKSTHKTLDSSLRVQQQEISSIQRKTETIYNRDPPLSIPKRDVTSLERANYRRQPTQVRNNIRKYQIMWRDMHFAPFRSFNDFILDATWNVPNFNNDVRIHNRIISNLMYYQTNYFMFGIICLILIGIMHPVDFIISLLLIVTFLLRSTILVILLGAAYYKLSITNTLIIVLFGIALPLLGMFSHAIFRKRNLMNKVSNQVDRIRLQKTPMAAFLKMLELVDDD